MKSIDPIQIKSTKNRRIELLYEQCPSSAKGSFAASILVFAIFYWETSSLSYLFWALPAAGVSLARVFLAEQFLKKKPDIKKYQQWLNYYIISVVFSGITWASFIFIDLSDLSLNFRTLSFLTIVFICFGAISNYSYIVKVFATFMTTLSLVFVAGLLITQGTSYVFFIALFAGLYPSLLVTSKRFNTNIIQSITQQDQVKSLLYQLELNNRQLEDKVQQRTKELVKEKDKAEAANQAKSEFLANVTHELRTPMHAILSFSDLGNKKTSTSTTEKIQGYFQKINKSGFRLLDFVNDLLDLSKMEAGQYKFKPKENNLNDVISESLYELSSQIQEKEIELSFKQSPTLDNNYFDGSGMHQVITNLLSNAIKFSPVHGKITITCEQTLDNFQIVSIFDQGVGVPPAELEHIFDKFTQSSLTTTGAGGTGLGLSICKQIILSHCGRIWAENCNNSGACFCFKLPIKEICK